MKYQYPPNYGADNLDYRVFNEERVISSDVERVIVLDYGAYFSSTLKIKNKATGLTLVAGKDYICSEADFVAMSKSGREVCKQITIKTKAVTEILIDYMFVGGEHMSGLHLMREMARVYPDGLESRYEWDKISDKPITFKPEHHLMHVNQLYGFDGVAYSMDRMIAGVKRGHENNQNRFMVNILKKLETMTGDLKDELDEAQNLHDELFDILSVQEGEFIFTDRLDNPAVSRKYGNWVRVTDVILRGRSGNEMLADDAGNIYSKTHNQQIRDCYIWQNLDGQYGVTYKLTFTNAVSAGTYDVDTDITVKLQTTGIVDGTPVYFTIYDETTGKPASINDVYPGSRGSFVIERGVATTDIRFLAKPNSGVQQRKYTFRLDGKLSVYGLLRVNEPDYKTAHPFFKSKLADVVLTNVDEGMTFRLFVNTQGYSAGELMYLDWNGSSIDSTAFTEPLPTTLTATTSSTTTTLLTLKENLISEGDRLLKVTIKKSRDEPITSDSPTTSIIINDSTVNPKADVYFRNSKNITVLEMDEGEKGTIVIDTDLISTDIEVQYSSGKPLSEFTGLKSDLTTNAVGTVNLPFGINEDFLTATGTQVLTVIVFYNGLEIGRNNLFIIDTSKAPNYQTFFTTEIGGDVVEGVGEGEEFYYNVKVDGWAATATPPVLNFKYMLAENAGTTKSEVAERIESSLYSAMAFDKSAAIYSEVSWNFGNTLSFKMKAKEDDIVENSTVFSIMCKQSNQTDYAYPAHIDIYDTSMYDVTGTWSSSATKLNPIMSADEMTSTGMNNIVYLWIQTEGDGSKVGDITLNTDANKEFVSVFPEVVRFEEGGQLIVVAVTILADFIKDGDMDIVLSGTYLPKGKTEAEILFEAPLTIIDNSFRTPIEIVAHVSENAHIAPADKKFTAWKHVYVSIAGIPYGFDTTVKWKIIYTDSKIKGKFIEETGIAEMPSGADNVTFSIKPRRDTNGTGDVEFKIVAERIFTERGIAVSDETTSEGYIILDDAAPMSYDIGLYATPTSTEKLTSVDEGTTSYFRYTITNPDDYYRLGFEPHFGYDVGVGGVVDMDIDGTNVMVVGYDTGKYEDIPIFNYIGYITPVDKPTVVVINVPIPIGADRATDYKQHVLWYDGVMVSVNSSDVPTPANKYETTLYNSKNKLKDVIALGDHYVFVNDTSKPSSYKLTPSATYIADEGEVVPLTVDITDANLGDVLYIRVKGEPTITADRIELNPAGIEKVAMKMQETLIWDFKAFKNRKTDESINGYLPSIDYEVYNESLGRVVGNFWIRLTDSSKTPDNKPRVVKDKKRTVTVPLNEGETDNFLYLTGDNYDTDEEVKLEWVAGRPKEDFPEGIWTTYPLVSEYDTNTRKYYTGAMVPFNLDYDRKTNTPERSYVRIRVSLSLSGIVSEHDIAIVDTSQDPAILEMRWVKQYTTTVVNSINEAEKVILEVRVNGGTQPTEVKLTNNGGRSIERMKEHSYDVTLSRTSDETWLQFPFMPLADGTTNTGADKMLNVRLDMVGLNSYTTTSLPINDTSTDTQYQLELLDPDTLLPVNYMHEKINYILKSKIIHPVQDRKYTLDYGYHSFWAKSGNQKSVVSSTTGADIETTVSNIYVNTSNNVPTVDALTQHIKLTDNVTGNVVATLDVPIVTDNPTTLRAASFVGVGATTNLSSLYTGYSYELYIPANSLSAVIWDYGENHKLTWAIYDTTDPDNPTNALITPASGTFTVNDITYVNGVGTIRLPIKVKYDSPLTGVVVKVYDEYDFMGDHIKYLLMKNSSATTIYKGIEAPALTKLYWSSSSAGVDEITTVSAGGTAYLCCSAVNINDGNIGTSQSLPLTWEESTFQPSNTTTGNFTGYMTLQMTDSKTFEYFGYVEVSIKSGIKLTGLNNKITAILRHAVGAYDLAKVSAALTVNM